MSDNKTIIANVGGIEIGGLETSRRGFLKNALMLGGALALVGSSTAVMAEEGHEGKKKGKKKGKGKKKKSEHHSN